MRAAGRRAGAAKGFVGMLRASVCVGVEGHAGENSSIPRWSRGRLVFLVPSAQIEPSSRSGDANTSGDFDFVYFGSPTRWENSSALI